VTGNMMRHIIARRGSDSGLKEADLLSFWAAGLVDGPAVVRPTGLECLGPLPGIFKPLDFSMFIMSTGETSSFAAYLGLSLYNRGTKCEDGGYPSPFYLWDWKQP